MSCDFSSFTHLWRHTPYAFLAAAAHPSLWWMQMCRTVGHLLLTSAHIFLISNSAMGTYASYSSWTTLFPSKWSLVVPGPHIYILIRNTEILTLAMALFRESDHLIRLTDTSRLFQLRKRLVAFFFTFFFFFLPKPDKVFEEQIARRYFWLKFFHEILPHILINEMTLLRWIVYTSLSRTHISSLVLLEQLRWWKKVFTCRSYMALPIKGKN